jgi:threonine/homoserine/homoserine lactone efflux protein
MNTLLSMAAFALVSSITPGPVNLVALDLGARHGWRASLRYVTGATIGFTALLLMVGFGMQGFVAAVPAATGALRWAGCLFLLVMAWQLAAPRAEPGAAADIPARRPAFLAGAAMQWLNPKAWLASLAGTAAYAAADQGRVFLFAIVYCAICWASVACWAGAGRALGMALRHERRLRWFNRAMAALLAATALAVLAG